MNRVVFFFCACVGIAPALAEPLLLRQDPHRNALGFFDMHLCNWPGRPAFFKVLFATDLFPRIRSMQVLDPTGEPLLALDQGRYRQILRKGRPERRVFMQDLPVPKDAVMGWYSIRVTDIDGEVFTARDLVAMTRLERVGGMIPDGSEQAVSLPEKLVWDPVPGAGYYQVYLRDAWSDELIFSSKLLRQPQVRLPAGLLEPGGVYSWTVHARDTNEHILLGDFHNGSLSRKAVFSVAQ